MALISPISGRPHKSMMKLLDLAREEKLTFFVNSRDWSIWVSLFECPDPYENQDKKEKISRDFLNQKVISKMDKSAKGYVSI